MVFGCWRAVQLSNVQFCLFTGFDQLMLHSTTTTPQHARSTITTARGRTSLTAITDRHKHHHRFRNRTRRDTPARSRNCPPASPPARPAASSCPPWPPSPARSPRPSPTARPSALRTQRWGLSSSSYPYHRPPPPSAGWKHTFSPQPASRAIPA